MSRFEVPTPIHFGPGSRLEVLPILRMAKFRTLGVVIDAGIVCQPVFSEFLKRDLPSAGFDINVEFDSRSDREPDYDYLDRSVEVFRGRPLDCILGIGGGSAMDLAKGIAILLTNPGKGMDYRGSDLVQIPGVPLVLFPTTAGSGSEVTRTASFVDLREKRKLGINGRYVSAYVGVLDPVLTLGCPAQPTMSAGLDALVHCVESFTAATSSSLAREIAKTAFHYVFNNLPKVLENPQDIKAREKMLLGSHLAAIALSNAGGGGPASAISYPMGVFYGVPHGFAGGVLLPYVVRYNVVKGYEGYAALYDQIEERNPRPPHGRSLAFADALEAMYERIDAPKDFVRWDVTTDAVSTLVEDTLRNRAVNLTHNPVLFAAQEVEALIRRVARADAAPLLR